MTNATKSLVWDRQQEPFGEDHAVSGSGSTTLRFPGQLADNESDLNYNYFRDYDPSLGRYIEADPIELEGSSVANMNIYGYANQNAVRYTDPTGENIFVYAAEQILPKIASGILPVIEGALIGKTIDRLCVAANDNTAPEPPPESKNKCPFVRELPEHISTPGNRTCIYQCEDGLKKKEYSRAFGPCEPYILPFEGQPYSQFKP